MMKTAPVYLVYDVVTIYYFERDLDYVYSPLNMKISPRSIFDTIRVFHEPIDESPLILYRKSSPKYESPMQHRIQSLSSRI